ncbi:hypothetical protein HHK36_022744 [Tetracentron sinense]|uniref:DYW domain-containing protein n=1 Tax=Tetracentron sinense TaxID=13715 RepID=A0A835D954_TETSI|nr:hypothetical protein HHK36_022744 [Tetracentron sinense]
MRRREGIGIDRFSFLPLLKASARVSALDEGMEIHGLASNLGFDSDTLDYDDELSENVDVHISEEKKLPEPINQEVGELDESSDEHPEIEVSGLYDDVLLLFEEMKSSNVEPDVMVLATMLSACGRAENLNSGKATHEYISKKNFKVDSHLQSALITMYSSCGSMDSAQRLFDNMSPKNLVASTAMVCEYSKLGMIKAAGSIFDQMLKESSPQCDLCGLVSVLYACIHAGLVEKGCQIFASMIQEYNITIKQEHYGCIVDLLGRAYLLMEALKIIEAMSFPPNVVIWGSLMAACRVHEEFELGEFAAKQLLEVDPEHDGAHILLSSIYANARRWKDVGEVRKLMKNRGIIKERGCSRIELNNEIHEFMMADRNHKQADEIYEKLDEVVSDLKLVGYAPNIGSVLVDLEEEEKKEVVLWHSEKLALCIGLMSVGKGSCIRIVNNLRVCEDCNTSMKLVSKVFEKEIGLGSTTIKM